MVSNFMNIFWEPRERTHHQIDDSTLLVTYNLSEQLHLYRIRIIWSAPPQPKWNGQQQIPGGPLPAPTLDVACLMVEDNCVPVGPSSDSLDPPSTSGPKTILPVRLTHLDFLTAVAENAGITANPTVVATFTHNPNLANSLDPTQPQQNPFSIISRWEFDYRHEVKLHASLTELAKHKRPKTEDASVNTYPSSSQNVYSRNVGCSFEKVGGRLYKRYYLVYNAFHVQQHTRAVSK